MLLYNTRWNRFLGKKHATLTYENICLSIHYLLLLIIIVECIKVARKVSFFFLESVYQQLSFSFWFQKLQCFLYFSALSKLHKTPSPFYGIRQVTTSYATFLVELFNKSSSCTFVNLCVTSCLRFIYSGNSASKAYKRSSFLYMYFINLRLRSTISFKRFYMRYFIVCSWLDCGFSLSG